MNDAALWAELRTTLARLELVSGASVGAYNSGGGGGDAADESKGGKRPPGDPVSPADWFRGRLRTVEAGERRKLEQAVDVHAIRLAFAWAKRAREQILTDARAELAELTGRSSAPPRPRDAALDRPGELEALVLKDGEGHPAEVVAVKFKLSEHMVRRIRRRATDPDTDDPAPRDPETGKPVVPDKVPAGEERRRRAAAMVEQGMSERQIAFALGCDRKQVRRDLGRAA